MDDFIFWLLFAFVFCLSYTLSNIFFNYLRKKEIERAQQKHRNKS